MTKGGIVTDFSRVSDIITNEVNRRAAGENVIVKEELIIRIISPNVISLTLVDLPGLVSVSLVRFIFLIKNLTMGVHVVKIGSC